MLLWHYYLGILLLFPSFFIFCTFRISIKVMRKFAVSLKPKLYYTSIFCEFGGQQAYTLCLKKHSRHF